MARTRKWASTRDPELTFIVAAERRCLQIAQEIVEEIKLTRAFKDESGDLRVSYSAVIDGNGGALVVNDNAFYWRFLEYGTANMKARPHVVPAVETVRGRHT